VSLAVPSGAPHNFTASSAGATSIRLQWDPPVKRHRNGEIALYELLYHERRDPADDWPTNTTDTFIVIDGLQPTTDYVFHIRAYTSEGAGPWSSQLPFRTTNMLRERCFHVLNPSQLEHVIYETQRYIIMSSSSSYIRLL